MKANEAPEKIYIEVTPDGTRYYRDIVKEQKTENSDIEYTRTDAFVKKAKEAFCKATCQGNPPRDTCTSLGTCREYDNFVKFLKGE